MYRSRMTGTPADDGPPRTPQWVLVLAAVFVAVLVVLLVGALLVVEHGPGLHS